MNGTTDRAPPIDASLVRKLVDSQFPKWSDLSIESLLPGGWDHRSFRLGCDMVVRLPSASAYAMQVEKEHRWLPVLAPWLPLVIPEPLALGNPAHGYSWHWAIRRWIEGEAAASCQMVDRSQLARDVAQFLDALHRIDSRDGPSPGRDNFFRGGPLAKYDAEARCAIDVLGHRIDTSAAMRLWTDALATEWRRPPVWIHGDMSAGNLLVREGRLCAVIDFGSMAVGDPACDLAIAWTFLDGYSRSVFRSALQLDDGTWKRACGWALWKASIVAAGIAKTNAVEEAQSWRTIEEILGRGNVTPGEVRRPGG